MECESAVILVEQIILEPGWSITAEDHTKRFEGTIKIRVDYPARNTNRDQAESNFPERICTYATFTIVAHDCHDDIDLYRAVIGILLRIKEHEIREYFRVRPTNWAPFHPHRVDSMRRWGSMDYDLNFGIV